MNDVKNKTIRIMMLDTRTGHSQYLMFFLVFLNFILISINFIPDTSFEEEIPADEIIMYTGIFLIIYCPLATLIGAWHRKTQTPVEQDILRKQDPILAKSFKILLDIKTGEITKKDTEEFREFLLKIEERKF
jgi:hypothetical protein